MEEKFYRIYKKRRTVSQYAIKYFDETAKEWRWMFTTNPEQWDAAQLAADASGKEPEFPLVYKTSARRLDHDLAEITRHFVVDKFYAEPV